MKTALAPALLAVALLGACEARQLYIAHDTVIGVNAAVNQARSSGRLMIGYDRDFVTVIPRSVDVAELGESGAGREAMSAIACSEVEVDGVFLTRFVEHVATGRAARNFAQALANGGADGRPARSAAESADDRESIDRFLSCFEMR